MTYIRHKSLDYSFVRRLSKKLTPIGIGDMNHNTMSASPKELLHTFLGCRMNQGKPNEATMTGLAGGSWVVSDADYKTFLDLMNAYHFEGSLRNPPLPYAEQPRVNTPKPLLIDLDFKYPKDRSVHHSFTQEMIEDFCNVLKEGINTFFDLSEYSELKFFVLLRPQGYVSGETIKDGIHIECPDFVLSDDKWNVLRQWVLHENAIQRIFGPTRYLNLETDIFDASMGKKQGWMFYGCSKSNTAPYELSYIKLYDPESNTWNHDTGSQYSSRQLLEMLSIRYNLVDECGEIRPDKKDEFDHLLSLHRSKGKHLPSMPPASSAPSAPVPLDATQQTVRETLLSLLPNADDERILIRRLVLECLTTERCDNHDDWMRVGWCLHNIEPSEDMFNLWTDFSKKSYKWDDHRHHEVPLLRRDWFHGMRKDGDGPRLTDKSLHKWAREDNRAQYELIMNEDILEYIIKYVGETHYHVAKLMEKMFQTTYKASFGLRSIEWYNYDEVLNMWKHINQGIDIKKKICFEVSGKVDQAIQRMKDRFGKTVGKASSEDGERILKKIEDLHKLQTKLFNMTFVEAVTKMAGLFFAEEDFTKKLNMNPYLVGFSNGILELRYKDTPTSKPRILFRQGKPEDYVSFLAGRIEAEMDAISYRPYDPNDPLIPEIMGFFDKLFPKVELRDYVLKLMSSCLEGANPEQCYYIFTGRGSNGKSKLMDLMSYTLGDYITSIQATVLTRKRPDSGAANPDVIVAKCRRFIFMQEPDAKEPLNTSRMKQFSGEDLVEARALYGDQEKFKIMGKLFMMCNDLPPIYSMDNGTWRRIRVVPFESTFRSPEHPDWKSGKSNIYLKDENLGLKLKEWRESFMSLLVHIYETQYLVSGLHPEPLIVLKASDSYKESFDVFSKFYSERIRYEVTAPRIDFKELKRQFQNWRKDCAIKANLSDTEIWNRIQEINNVHILDSKKQIMSQIRVFSSDEEVENYDQQKNGILIEDENEEEED